MEKVARTIYMTLWEVANLPVRPKVDKPLPAQFDAKSGVISWTQSFILQSPPSSRAILTR